MSPPKLITRVKRFFHRDPVRAKLQRNWEELWSQADVNEPWMKRPISPEIAAAVEDRWFVAGSQALDVGCGEGEVSHWLSERGFPTLGVDFAAAAIERARKRYGEVPGQLEFQVLDLVREAIPDRQYAVVVDRGCFHAIKHRDSPRYVRNLAAACAPGARFLLFIRAYRGDLGDDEAAERRSHDAFIHRKFGGRFELLRSAETYLGRPGPGPRDPKMRGLVYWMTRR